MVPALAGAVVPCSQIGDATASVPPAFFATVNADQGCQFMGPATTVVPDSAERAGKSRTGSFVIWKFPLPMLQATGIVVHPLPLIKTTSVKPSPLKSPAIALAPLALAQFPKLLTQLLVTCHAPPPALNAIGIVVQPGPPVSAKRACEQLLDPLPPLRVHPASPHHSCLPHARAARLARLHFFGIAARTMRQVLVDHARRRTTAKRGDGARPITLDEALVATSRSDELVAL
jgi:hypothetical protein